MSDKSKLIDIQENANAAAAFLEGAQLTADMLDRHSFKHHSDAKAVKASINTQSILLRQALDELDAMRETLKGLIK